MDGRAKVRGAAAPGEVFAAADFLHALSPGQTAGPTLQVTGTGWAGSSASRTSCATSGS